MNDLYIRGLKIDWDDIDKYSYLHGISSIRSISELTKMFIERKDLILDELLRD